MLATISSSKPRMDSISFSIQRVSTDVLTLVKSTGWEKEGGNLVDRRSLVCAELDEIDDVCLQQ